MRPPSAPRPTPSSPFARLRASLTRAIHLHGPVAGAAVFGARQLVRVLLAPRALWQRWTHRHNEWERTDIRPADLVGGADEWDEVAASCVAFLRARGLRPSDRLLDAGCGNFRIGRVLIDYLEPAGYAAFDGSARLLADGRRVLEREGLGHKRPVVRQLLVADEPVDLSAHFQGPFDVLLLHAVLDHLPPGRIVAFLASLRTVMGEGSRLFATFFLNPFGDDYAAPILRRRRGGDYRSVTTRADREYWHHTPAQLERLAARAGLRLVALHDYAHPLEGLTMAEFERRVRDLT